LFEAVWCRFSNRLAWILTYQVIVLYELARHGARVLSKFRGGPKAVYLLEVVDTEAGGLHVVTIGTGAGVTRDTAMAVLVELIYAQPGLTTTALRERARGARLGNDAISAELTALEVDSPARVRVGQEQIKTAKSRQRAQGLATSRGGAMALRGSWPLPGSRGPGML
jgi:hypothetical protein